MRYLLLHDRHGAYLTASFDSHQSCLLALEEFACETGRTLSRITGCNNMDAVQPRNVPNPTFPPVFTRKRSRRSSLSAQPNFVEQFGVSPPLGRQSYSTTRRALGSSGETAEIDVLHSAEQENARLVTRTGCTRCCEVATYIFQSTDCRP